jgi:3-oxoacyl-[acyl-carrier protein] reductase
MRGADRPRAARGRGLLVSESVAIVTGGSRGIGRAICAALAATGARVVVNYRSRREEAAAVVEAVRGAGGVALAIQADVRRPQEVEAMVAQILERFGRVDILVNNAGVVRDGLLPAMPWGDWREVIETNLDAVFLCTKAVARPMLLRRRGRIINISSIVSERRGIGQCNYAAAKGGLNALTRALARELAPRGITVNAVAPGAVLTDMTRAYLEALPPRDPRLPLVGRVGVPEDIASVVVFLASDAARFITGEVIHVNGGTP